MNAGAAATRSVPSVCLAPTLERDAILAARYYGADGVCLGPALAAPALAELAGHVRSTRMLPLGVVETPDDAPVVVAAGLRAVVVRAATVAEVVALAAALPRNLALVADVAALDEAGLRALAGHVDAALLPADLHSKAAALVAELEP